MTAAEHRCTNCGYSLADLPAPICPECGSAIPSPPRVRLRPHSHSIQLNFAVALQLVAHGIIIVGAGHGAGPLGFIYLASLEPDEWTSAAFLGWAGIALSIVALTRRWGDVKVAAAAAGCLLLIAAIALWAWDENDGVLVGGITTIPFLGMAAWVLVIAAGYFGEQMLTLASGNQLKPELRSVLLAAKCVLAPFVVFIVLAFAGRALDAEPMVAGSINVMACVALISPGVGLLFSRKRLLASRPAGRHGIVKYCLGFCAVCWILSALLNIASRWMFDIPWW